MTSPPQPHDAETLEERRKAQTAGIGDDHGSYYTPAASLDRLLRHFEETGQQPVADAIRFGTKPEPYCADCGDFLDELVYNDGLHQQEYPHHWIRYFFEIDRYEDE